MIFQVCRQHLQGEDYVNISDWAVDYKQVEFFVVCDLFKEVVDRLELWFSGNEHVLLFQRTRVQVPTHTSGGLQTSVTPAPWIANTSGLFWYLHSHVHNHTEMLKHN